MALTDASLPGALPPLVRPATKPWGLAAATTGSHNGSETAVHSCQEDSLPTIHEYLAAINIAGVTLFAVCGVAVVCVVLLYADTLKHIMRKAPSSAKTNSAFVLSVYPVVAMSTYCAMVVPRAHLLAEAVTQGIFTAALYQLFCLCMSYGGGEAHMISAMSSDSLSLRVGPCCCWPCCCLPNLQVNKRHIQMLRILVLQLPVIQALVHMVLLVMWAEEESLYHVNYMYFQPLIAVSILCGMWGMTMMIKMLSTFLTSHKLNLKFLVLQMVLLLSKLQGLITRIILWSNILPCKPPISPTVYVNVIYNTMMIAEMAALCFLARFLYVRDLEEKEPTEKKQEEGVEKASDQVRGGEEVMSSSCFTLDVVAHAAPGKLMPIS
ncbi:organic solute transporter subunit alpha [Hetaerina americana]|uniref:organic solute transporter subunit alpha n=1 Tax=Hetaerina americana TaxID=62018 RepID=UPI003A7F50E0